MCSKSSDSSKDWKTAQSGSFVESPRQKNRAQESTLILTLILTMWIRVKVKFKTWRGCFFLKSHIFALVAGALYKRSHRALSCWQPLTLPVQSIT